MKIAINWHFELIWSLNKESLTYKEPKPSSNEYALLNPHLQRDTGLNSSPQANRHYSDFL
ncbi:hypothetical protein [Vibrio proteolyticus]|uniref:Uncharacterized protein n=1 Tax=Vibrio proteolyticus NBRC 13287 TaxID=1219065 RepID=U3A2R8_VIBPR|nr:hypothetical protein [Vibrio proteolyticus]GAD67975.1 hypothetical protein VPR01S_10_01710 [Vibrio proteolyticus NBRC 13287]